MLLTILLVKTGQALKKYPVFPRLQRCYYIPLRTIWKAIAVKKKKNSFNVSLCVFRTFIICTCKNMLVTHVEIFIFYFLKAVNNSFYPENCFQRIYTEIYTFFLITKVMFFMYSKSQYICIFLITFTWNIQSLNLF